MSPDILLSDLLNIADIITSESAEDLVGLWEIIKLVQQLSPESDDDRVKSETLYIVTILISRGLVAGDPPYAKKGYRPWREKDAHDVVTRISREWSSLGRMPNIPDIVWFSRQE